ncbi:MAG: SMC-Scp complex subunit ScpB [Candidatus Aminicenantes bacterium]
MKKQLKEIIESLIFVSLEPLSLAKIKVVLQEFPEQDIEQAIKELLESYVSNKSGIHIIQSAGGYLFATKPEFDTWIRRLLRAERTTRLSSASLETLSVIAYHQPITLSHISDMRGVDSNHTIKVLLQRKLIKIAGRKKSPGKPFIYRTTDKFLAHFGLNSIKDLPSQEEISKIVEEEKEA